METRITSPDAAFVLTVIVDVIIVFLISAVSGLIGYQNIFTLLFCVWSIAWVSPLPIGYAPTKKHSGEIDGQTNHPVLVIVIILARLIAYGYGLHYIFYHEFPREHDNTTAVIRATADKAWKSSCPILAETTSSSDLVTFLSENSVKFWQAMQQATQLAEGQPQGSVIPAGQPQRDVRLWQSPKEVNSWLGRVEFISTENQDTLSLTTGFRDLRGGFWRPLSHGDLYMERVAASTERVVETEAIIPSVMNDYDKFASRPSDYLLLENQYNPEFTLSIKVSDLLTAITQALQLDNSRKIPELVFWRAYYTINATTANEATGPHSFDYKNEVLKTEDINRGIFLTNTCMTGIPVQVAQVL